MVFGYLNVKFWYKFNLNEHVTEFPLGSFVLYNNQLFDFKDLWGDEFLDPY